MIRKVFLAIFVVFFISGCQYVGLTHLTRVKPLDTETAPQAILIDAKQRSILATKDKEAFNKFCAEPSPDALSALAASQGFSLSLPETGDLGQSLSLSEGAASIGLRTQSIQLMRDAMYRLCEGYLSDSLNEPSFQSLFRRLENSMVAILAIEQLTGVQKATPVAISGTAIVGAAELVGKYTELTEQARQKVRDAENKVDEAKTKLEDAEEKLRDQQELQTTKQEEVNLAANKYDPDTPPPDDADQAVKDSYAALKTDHEKKKSELELINEEITKATTARDTAKSDLEDAESTLSERQELFDSNNSARIAAMSDSGSTSVTVQITEPNINNSKDCCEAEAEKIKAIADNVTAIVKTTLELDFTIEACASVVNNTEWTKKPDEGSVAAQCISYLKAKTDIAIAVASNLTAEANVKEARANILNTQATLLQSQSAPLDTESIDLLEDEENQLTPEVLRELRSL